MKKTRGQPVRNDGNDYERGYLEGMRAAFEDSELDAYYAGVGYGKKAAGDKHIGFNSAEEREQFKKGIAKKDEHFRSYRAEPPTFWERLFGASEQRKRYKKNEKVKKKYNKRHSKSAKRFKRRSGN